MYESFRDEFPCKLGSQRGREREERKRDEERHVVYVTPREHDRTSLNARHLYFRFTARIFAAPDSF